MKKILASLLVLSNIQVMAHQLKVVSTGDYLIISSLDKKIRNITINATMKARDCEKNYDVLLLEEDTETIQRGEKTVYDSFFSPFINQRLYADTNMCPILDPVGRELVKVKSEPTVFECSNGGKCFLELRLHKDGLQNIQIKIDHLD